MTLPVALENPLRTFFVSAFGSDANPGTDANSPLRTFAAAERLALDGDTIKLAAGDYPEPLVTRKSLHVEGETAPAGFTLPGDPRGEFRRPLVRFTGLTSGGHNSCRLDRSERPVAERRGGSLRGLRFDNDANTLSNLFMVFCHDFVVEDCWCLDGQVWNAHAGWCDGGVWRRCLFVRSHQQHNLYIANAPKGGLVEWNLMVYAEDNNFQINADLNTQPGNGEVYDGIASDFVIQDNFWCFAATDASGVACNLDGLVHSVVRRNRVWKSGSSGINLHSWDGAVDPHHVEITDNWVYCLASTCLNLLPGVRDLTVTGNVLANERPSYIDDSGTPPPTSMIANNTTGLGNPYPAGYWDWLPQFEPLLPPPPPPPPPADPEPDPVPDTAPLAVASDKPRDDANRRLARVWEYDTGATAGPVKDPSWTGLVAIPVPFVDYYTSPLKGVPRDKYGIRWVWLWVPDRSGVVQFRLETRGKCDVSFAGNAVLDSFDPDHSKTLKWVAFTVEAGKAYLFDAGLGCIGSTVGAMNISHRWSTADAFVALSSGQCYPELLGPTVPPVDPTNPTAPGWREPFTPEQKAHLLWMRDLFLPR